MTHEKAQYKKGIIVGYRKAKKEQTTTSRYAYNNGYADGYSGAVNNIKKIRLVKIAILLHEIIQKVTKS